MKTRHIGIAALFCLIAVPAAAQIRVADQSNVNPNPPPMNSISVSVDRYSVLGQSFMPTLPGIKYATFDMRNDFTFNTSPVTSPMPNQAVNYTVSLYSGFGNYNGAALLGTSAITTIPAGTAYSSVFFQFNNVIPLTPGQTYTLVVNDLYHAANPNLYDDAAIYIGNDTYAGGQATFTSSGDLYFSEGILAAVPEPAAWLFMILGFGAAGGTLRRKRADSRKAQGARLLAQA